ncbi:MAG TPA: hypothetical protein DEA96_04860 [Leptospiraceae bacterium]|nr:hypothetical protein [Spirochaetaceae bacterium]HBS04274.1 hypothetical protein [Leptospiraceae bacterium]|tara:strand:- start:31422 stop:31856 length:435 start_codon:yes stop_codon:yes gene_type:complete
MSLQIKFTAVFALLGLAVSLVFGLMSGNSLTHVVITALICTVLSAALGVGVYQVLKNRVPEFLDLLSGSGEASDLAEDELGSLDALDASGDEDLPDEGGESPFAEGTEPERKEFGDHILVDKVKVKNNPRLMASAIRTMLSRDE